MTRAIPPSLIERTNSSNFELSRRKEEEKQLVKTLNNLVRKKGLTSGKEKDTRNIVGHWLPGVYNWTEDKIKVN